MRRSRPTRSVLLAVVVVLAGCGTIAGSDPGAKERLTPAPVPTTDSTYPPGVTESGVVVPALADAHVRGLLSAGFTLTSHRRIVESNGTLWWAERTRRVAPGGDTYAGNHSRSATESPFQSFPPLSVTYWTNGTVTAYHGESAGFGQSYTWVQGEPSSVDVTGVETLERSLGAVETTVREDDSGVVLVGSTIDRPDAFPAPPNVRRPRNVSLTARVSDAGIVTDWRLAYDATVSNRTVRVVREMHVTAVGGTTVRRPDWVADAANTTRGNA